MTSFLFTPAVSTTSVVGILFSLGLLAGWLFVRAAYWRADPGALDSRPPLWWFFGEGAWRGFLRSSAATMPIVALMLLCGFLAMAFGERSTPGIICGLTGAALLLLLIAVWVSVTLWNRPSFVVPPPLRSQPGTRGVSRRRRDRLRARQRR